MWPWGLSSSGGGWGCRLLRGRDLLSEVTGTVPDMERAGEDIFETVDTTPQGPLSGIMKCSVCEVGVVTATRRERAIYACPQDHMRVVQADADALAIGRTIGRLVARGGSGARESFYELPLDQRRDIMGELFDIELLPRTSGRRNPLAVNEQVELREL